MTEGTIVDMGLNAETIATEDLTATDATIAVVAAVSKDVMTEGASIVTDVREAEEALIDTIVEETVVVIVEETVVVIVEETVVVIAVDTVEVIALKDVAVSREGHQNATVSLIKHHQKT